MFFCLRYSNMRFAFQTNIVGRSNYLITGDRRTLMFWGWIQFTCFAFFCFSVRFITSNLHITIEMFQCSFQKCDRQRQTIISRHSCMIVFTKTISLLLFCLFYTPNLSWSLCDGHLKIRNGDNCGTGSLDEILNLGIKVRLQGN